MVAGPAEKTAFDKTCLGQHRQERPPPHRTGDSVRPLAFVGHFFRRHVLVQQDVGHLEPTARSRARVASGFSITFGPGRKPSSKRSNRPASKGWTRKSSSKRTILWYSRRSKLERNHGAC